MDRPTQHPINPAYELFIAALSVQSIINLFLIFLIADQNVLDVVVLIDKVFSLIFLADFFYRFFRAESKFNYFLRQFGWADLLACAPFPQAKLLRVFHIVRTGRAIQQNGGRAVVHEFVRNRGGSALMTVLFFIMLVLEFGSMVMLAVEGRSPDANIVTASDALWYTYVTITTVGYGDRYPVTSLGRFVGSIVLITGVGLFGILTGYLANAFVARPQKKQDAETVMQPPELEARLAEMIHLLAEQQKAQIELQERILDMERSRTEGEP